MTSASYVPEDPEGEHWDVAVIGTGMGGSTLGHALTQRGHRVLFLEKGRRHADRTDRGNPIDSGFDPYSESDPEARLRHGWWPLALQGDTSFGAVELFAPWGCGTGGTTALYAAQLERFDPVDFRPRVNYPGVPDSTLPERWPIGYEELVPYYRQAEQLYRVCGTPDPLNDDPGASLTEPPRLSERDALLFARFRERGLHPYRAHVGYQFIDGCTECGAMICPRACKSDAATICLEPALAASARILPECEVVRLTANRTSVESVDCRWNGRDIRVRAKTVVLAAGAYVTPALLLKSTSADWPDGLANRSGLVGRNLMLHAGDFVAVKPEHAASNLGPDKAISFNDFYFVDGRKLGTFQSVGIPVTWGYVLAFLRSLADKDPRWWRKLSKPLLRPVAHVAAHWFRHAAVFATIVEDLPYHDNRIVLDPNSNNGFRFEYRYTDELRERNRLFRRRLVDVLGSRRVAVLSAGNNLNYGHVCGTCRFGDDPNTSVLNRDNRAHDVENLHVVDASFFPSSGGTNPSLTIAANALRVAESIDAQLRGPNAPMQ